MRMKDTQRGGFDDAPNRRLGRSVNERRLFALPSCRRPQIPARLAVIFFLALDCLFFFGCGRPKDQSSIISAQVRRADIFGTIIHFDQTREAQGYQVSGWSPTEKYATWSEGKSAVLAIPLPSDFAGGVRLRLHVNAYTHPPELPTQPVEVYANGHKVAHWDVAPRAQHFADIPKEIISRSKTLTLEFQTPEAVSPAVFDPGGDPRVLGICCHDMELTALP